MDVDNVVEFAGRMIATPSSPRHEKKDRSKSVWYETTFHTLPPPPRCNVLQLHEGLFIADNAEHPHKPDCLSVV